MTRKISISLTDRGSIKDAIKQIKDYEKDLKEKTKLFLEKLADKGILVAELSAMGDSHKFSEMVKFEKEWQGQKLCLIGRNDDLSGLRTEWYDADGNYHNDIISPILMLEYGSALMGSHFFFIHIKNVNWYLLGCKMHLMSLYFEMSKAWIFRKEVVWLRLLLASEWNRT